MVAKAPNRNVLAERWVQSDGRECLDHLLVFGAAHLRRILAEYVAHDNAERSRQGLGNRPLTGPRPGRGGVRGWAAVPVQVGHLNSRILFEPITGGRPTTASGLLSGIERNGPDSRSQRFVQEPT
jgi:hypothetical protein